MRRSTHGAAPAAALSGLLLALALLAAAPAAARACSYYVAADHTDGPFPSPLGGAWFVLPRFDDGSLEAVHFAADGKPTGSVRLAAPELDLFEQIFGHFAVDADGGFRVTALPRDGGPPGHHLVAFDADGAFLGRVAVEGKIFGFDAAGDAWSYLRRPDGRLAVHRLDAVSSLAREMFVTAEPVMPGAADPCGDPFTLASDGEGAVFLLTSARLSGAPLGSLQILQRFTADGDETATWRLPERERYQLIPGHAGTVVLVEGGYPAVLWSVGADGVAGHLLVVDGEGFQRAVPADDGGWILRQEEDVRWIGADGAVGGRLRLGPTPQGATWRDLEERIAGAGDTPVARALWGGGADADAAEAELLAGGAPAVDQLVEWCAGQPPGGDPYGGSCLTRLLVELVDRDPDAVGARAVALLDRLPDVHRSDVVEVLVTHWPQPSPSFVALLEDDVQGADDWRLRVAAGAFEWLGGAAPVAADVVASGFADRLLAADEPAGFAFAALAWRHLEGEPGLRARPETAFGDACGREVEALGGRGIDPPDAGLVEPPGCLLGMAVSGVGRQVPEAWLTADAEHLRRGDAVRRDPYRLLPVLSAVAERRGPWPGLAGLLRQAQQMDDDLLHELVDRGVLESALGLEPPRLGGRAVAGLPLLDLPELQGGAWEVPE